MTQGRRRCAICFYLDRDTNPKKGQIAHLDRRRSNSIEENLAFLCLAHHSEYDSTASQHKNFTVLEVKRARKALYRWVKRGMLLSHTGRASKSSKATGKPAARSAAEMPADRPKVRPVSYTVSPERFEGLQLTNEGTPAHDVQVETIRLADGWSVRFDELSYLEQTGFCPSWVSSGSESLLYLYGLWGILNMPPAVLSFTISYKDFEGHRYRSICELHRDVTKKSGFDVKFVRQERGQERQPFAPALAYEGITSGGNHAFTQGPLNLQVVTIRNVQLAVKNTAHNVEATIEYSHAGGDHFTVRRALWIENHLRAHVVNLGGNEAQSLVILLQSTDGTLYASVDENYFERELDLGHWNTRITITANNCESLVLEGGFTLFADETRKRLAYEQPALRAVSPAAAGSV